MLLTIARKGLSDTPAIIATTEHDGTYVPSLMRMDEDGMPLRARALCRDDYPEPA
jgi:hypothetical protein